MEIKAEILNTESYKSAKIPKNIRQSLKMLSERINIFVKAKLLHSEKELQESPPLLVQYWSFSKCAKKLELKGK